MNKQLLLFLSKILVFFLAIFALDSIYGAMLSYTLNHGGGDKNYYDYCLADEDVLVMGSSRCSHHYVSSIISDSLGYSVRNCGDDGMGIINMYAKYKAITQRHKPKLIIYDYFYLYDTYYEDNCELVKYIMPMRMYGDNPLIGSVIFDIVPSDRIKMVSQFYRYNSKSFEILLSYLRHSTKDTLGGYKPLEETMSSNEVVMSPYISLPEDPVKEKYLKQLIDDIKKERIPIVFVISPYYYKAMPERIQYFGRIIKQCEEWDIPIIVDIDDKELSYNYLNFKDKDHLNSKGAAVFSSKITSEIKKLIDI